MVREEGLYTRQNDYAATQPKSAQGLYTGGSVITGLYSKSTHDALATTKVNGDHTDRFGGHRWHPAE